MERGINLAAVWDYRAALLAAAGLAVLALARLLRRPGLARAAGAFAVAAGWTLLAWRPAPWLLVWVPRPGLERLVLAGLAILATALAGPALPGRLARWAPWLLAAFVGWWLASPYGSRPEFWRVWLAVGAWTILIVRLLDGDPPRAAAAGLGLWGALIAVGAAGWAGAAAVPAAAAAVSLLGGMELLPIAAAVATAAAAASLGTGQAARGVGAVDLAVLAPAAAALLHPVLTRRMARLGGGRAALAAVAAAAATVSGVAWMAGRAMR